jgi:hypothetical protein
VISMLPPNSPPLFRNERMSTQVEITGGEVHTIKYGWIESFHGSNELRNA